MPQTLRQWEDSLRQPALCELLPVRDYLDGCIIRTNGCFVAGYEASGLNTFFFADDTRNRTKEALEALVRSLPERSMRMQVRHGHPSPHIEPASASTARATTLPTPPVLLWFDCACRPRERMYSVRSPHSPLRSTRWCG